MESNDCITYQESGYFTPIITDYLNRSDTVRPYYQHFPDLNGFAKQIEARSLFNPEIRTVLHQVLSEQYSQETTSEITSKNIDKLLNNNCFTVCTGHQLNLFTGPLYFLYKIISTINLSKELKNNFPDKDFIPVYWMATEDHDFEEINHFLLRKNKIAWEKSVKGAVGRLSTEGLDEVFKVFSKQIGLSDAAQELRKLFKEAYLNHDTLANATRHLVNTLFRSHGLVILDADHPKLKRCFFPYLKKELLSQTSYEKISQTLNDFRYPVQVNPREINLFYLDQNLRERIIRDGNTFKVHQTSLEFSEKEIIDLMYESPEKFSPNVVLRPLYQEVILPNLCYIGGGGELAYWFELKSSFEAFEVPFPILLLRNSVLCVSKKQDQKRQKLGLSYSDLFQNQEILINQKASELAQSTLDFDQLKKQLIKQFDILRSEVLKTDVSFGSAVSAQEKKQLKGLDNLQKKLLIAQKKKHADHLDRIRKLQDELFPNQKLQERQDNFSEFFSEYGQNFIDKLFEELQPLENQFNILVFKDLETCSKT